MVCGSVDSGFKTIWVGSSQEDSYRRERKIGNQVRFYIKAKNSAAKPALGLRSWSRW